METHLHQHNDKHVECAHAVLAESFKVLAECNEQVAHGRSTLAPQIRIDSIVHNVTAALQSKRFASLKSLDPKELRSVVSSAVSQWRPVPITLVCGPLKNRRLGCAQAPDWAEFFQYVQLARLHLSILALYPPGLSIELLLDDARAEYANNVARDIFVQYAHGVQTLIEELSVGTWLSVASLFPVYERFDVTSYRGKAEVEVQNTFDAIPEEELNDIVRNAWENNEDGVNAIDAVQRYLVALNAETLAGVWSSTERIVMRYGRAPASMQRLWSVRKGNSDLPWQGIGGVVQLQDGEYKPCVWLRYRACSLELVQYAPVLRAVKCLPKSIPVFKARCTPALESACEVCPLRVSTAEPSESKGMTRL